MSDARFALNRHVRLALAAGALVVQSCRTGPDFVPPAPPVAPRYAEAIAALRAPIDSAGQHLELGQTVPLQWWEAFNSPELNAVVSQAVASSLTLASAQASLAQAREVLNQASGGRYPSVDASATAERQQSSAGGISGAPRRTTNIFSIGATVSYPMDLFGGIRRFVEEQAAFAEEARYTVATTYLAVTGNAVGFAITLASLRAQIEALNEILAYDQQNLDLVQAKFTAGKAARIDVLSALTQLESDRALLPPVQQQLATASHALSVLVGQLPSEWSPPPFDLAKLALPRALPVSIPSNLVHQRPDILAAEARLHASGAAIGVAGAQLYPNMTISGTLATQAASTSGLFKGSSILWNLIDGTTAPIFHGGALRAQERAAVDAYDATLAVYRQTTLAAFQQVADVLNTLAFDRQLADAQSRTLATSRELLGLQRISYDAGKSNILQLIDAQRSYQQSRLAQTRALASVYQDVAQLAVAMGGGWWQASDADLRDWGSGEPPGQP